MEKIVRILCIAACVLAPAHVALASAPTDSNAVFRGLHWGDPVSKLPPFILETVDRQEIAYREMENLCVATDCTASVTAANVIPISGAMALEAHLLFTIPGAYAVDSVVQTLSIYEPQRPPSLLGPLPINGIGYLMINGRLAAVSFSSPNENALRSALIAKYGALISPAVFANVAFADAVGMTERDGTGVALFKVRNGAQAELWSTAMWRDWDVKAKSIMQKAKDEQAKAAAKKAAQAQANAQKAAASW